MPNEPSPEETRLLAAAKKKLRTRLAGFATNHPVDLVVMELIREAAQRAREFNISLDFCLDQFRGEYNSKAVKPE